MGARDRRAYTAIRVRHDVGTLRKDVAKVTGADFPILACAGWARVEATAPWDDELPTVRNRILARPSELGALRPPWTNRTTFSWFPKVCAAVRSFRVTIVAKICGAPR